MVLIIETYLYKSNYIEKENIARVWDILKPLDGDSPGCNSFFYILIPRPKILMGMIN